MDLTTLLSDSRMFLSTWWIRSKDAAVPEESSREDGWVHCPGPHGCLMPPGAISDGSECCAESPEVPAYVDREASAIRYQIDLLSRHSPQRECVNVLILVQSFLRARYENVAFGTRAGLNMQEGWARRLYSDIESWAQVCAEQE